VDGGPEEGAGSERPVPPRPVDTAAPAARNEARRGPPPTGPAVCLAAGPMSCQAARMDEPKAGATPDDESGTLLELPPSLAAYVLRECTETKEQTLTVRWLPKGNRGGTR
jgi:hypothetical protein